MNHGCELPLDVAVHEPAYSLAPSSLIPAAWLATESADQFRIYNSALVCFGGRRLLAYRLDSGRGGILRRRIAICVLDEAWRVIPGSVVPFSNTIQLGGERHYDPRFLVYDNRLFIHYNNNYVTRPNQIYLVEVDSDTLMAKAPARPLMLPAPRQEIEKNWMLFAHEGEVWAVYTIAPHVILRVPLAGTGPIHCQRAFTTTWDPSVYSRHYGQLCGGAPPIRYGELYLSIFHSYRLVGALRHCLPLFPDRLIKGLPRYPAAVVRRLRLLCYSRRCFGGLYAFAAIPPFAPVWLVPTPILHPETELPRQLAHQIDPSSEKAVYPTGLVALDDNNLVVSYGVHEERCCLRRIDLAQAMKGAIHL